MLAMVGLCECGEMILWPPGRKCPGCGKAITVFDPYIDSEYRRMHTERCRIGSTFGAERRGHLKRMTRQLVMIDRRVIHGA